MRITVLFLFAVCTSISVTTGCALRRTAAPTPKVVATLPGGNWIYLCPGKTGQYVFVVEKVGKDDLTGKCVPAKDAADAQKAIALRYDTPAAGGKKQ